MIWVLWMVRAPLHSMIMDALLAPIAMTTTPYTTRI
jgi:hypothetical protein